MVKTLIVIAGPTGVGKTELSLKMAEFFGTCILNADSRQLYRDIPIGTAAPTAAELARVPHHFVGTLGLEDYYSAAQYEAEALALLDQLFQTRDVVVLSGGSMMYIDAVCDGIDDIPTIDDATRQRMKERYAAEGLEVLARELRLLDPEYYAICDIKNPKRVVHALEICYMTGRTYTSYRVKAHKERPFRIVKIGLCRERAELFDRINRRVDLMVEQGLLDEVRHVLPFRNCNSLNTVGYKELFQYIDGNWDLDFALEKIRRNSRVYAKKQMTWFKKDERTAWFHPEQWEDIRLFIENQIQAD
ncbi:tRNA delta(2)-isopentenylpyrophosphate transferase [gut metagenome]|uniref:tRNA dimethylallyltransferase n=1 Tax=gut metagenome TaxID=749906 RepID=J9G509_9ZZZZ